MSKTAQEVLLGLVRRAYNLTEQGVAELQESEGQFKDTALDELLKMDAERVTTLKGPDISERLTEKFKEGERRAAEALEKALAAEFKVKASDKKGIELIRHIVQESVSAAGSGKIDEDKVKLHPAYLELERQVQGHQAAVDAAVKAKADELRGEFEGELNSALVAEEAVTIFRGLRPSLSADAKVAAQQERDFIDRIRGGKFQVTKKDGSIEIVPLKQKPNGDWSRLEDAHSHPVSFEQYVGNLTRERFDLRASEDKEVAPDHEGVGKKTGEGSGSIKLGSKDAYFKAWGEIEEKHRADPKTMQAEHAKLKEAAKEQGVLP